MALLKYLQADGTARPSLVTEFLEKKWRVGASADEELVIENIANTVYGGAYLMSQSNTMICLPILLTENLSIAASDTVRHSLCKQ